MAVKTFEDALVEELKNLLSAEKQIGRALGQMARKVENPELKEGFLQHQKQTEEQAERLNKVFEALGKKPRTKRCASIEGIIGEGKEIMQQDLEPHVMDAMLVEAAQKIEHYEIAGYGTACTWAEQIGANGEAIKLLKQTLSEEKEMDQRLTKLAEETINKEALAVTA